MLNLLVVRRFVCLTVVSVVSVGMIVEVVEVPDFLMLGEGLLVHLGHWAQM